MKRLKDEQLFQLIRNFLTVYLPKQRMCSVHTIKSYKESINLLLSFFQSVKSVTPFDLTFEMLDSAAIQEFLSWIENERHCINATINQRLACIRSFMDYAGKMDASLIEHQNELKKITVRKGTLSENALKTLLEQPDTSTAKGIRDMFYMILLYDSGARNRELLNLRLGDIDLAPKHSRIYVTGKGNSGNPFYTKLAELLCT